MKTRLYNAMGLCQKAGKCVSGATAVEQALKHGQARLVILEETASEQTVAGYRAMCETRRVPFLQVETVGGAIGKPNRIVMAVTDKDFKKMIENALLENSQGSAIS